MSVSSSRFISIALSGDVVAPSLIYNAALNALSPGAIELKLLASGANTTISPPPTPTLPKAVTLSYENDENTVQVTLKGVAGDTGIALHRTDPSSIALNSPTGTFVLHATADVVVRLTWT